MMAEIPPVRINITVDVDPRFAELTGVGQEGDATQVIAAVREPSFLEIVQSSHIEFLTWDGKCGWLDNVGTIQYLAPDEYVPNGWRPILVGPSVTT